jgi:hypothetical protein
MSVQRFRTFEDARRALWLERGDPKILERLERLSALSRLSGDHPVKPGVTRFRSIEEAKDHRRQ